MSMRHPFFVADKYTCNNYLTTNCITHIIQLKKLYYITNTV